jgi:hypothetical protein
VELGELTFCFQRDFERAAEAARSFLILAPVMRRKNRFPFLPAWPKSDG